MPCHDANNAAPIIGVIADDLTGALDAGVQFALSGAETLLRLGDQALDSQVIVVSTDSRDGDQAPAIAQASHAAHHMQGRRLYKKIDSTMRGHITAEIKAILKVSRLERAVICPAVIGQERIVRDGRLYVRGVPLDASDFRHDPRWPADSADLATILGHSCTHLPLVTVRQGAQAAAETISRAPTQLITADAETAQDMACLGKAVAAASALPCGALGLAQAWSQALLPASTPPGIWRPTPLDGPALIVSGSKHPATQQQIAHALQHTTAQDVPATDALGTPLEANWSLLAQALAQGRSAILRAPHQPLPDDAARRALFETMGDWTARACAGIELAGLILIGGETARHVCRALHVQAIRLRAHVADGIPAGELVGGIAHGLPVVTKAGGFGQLDALNAMMDYVQ